jgi:hypothetical protein
MFKKIGIGVAALGAVLFGVYLRFIRPWHLRWGATDEEVQRPLPGDDQVPHPFVTATRAVTIDAPPEQVWPWLVQMGYRRAGWYAFERFDNDNIPSAEEIIPALQHLDIGQVIGEEGFAVQAIEPNRLLLLAFHYPKTEWVLKQGLWPKFGDCSWSILLDPIDAGQRTRLVLRMRYGCRLGLHVLYWPLFEPADFLSERKTLLGIKQRAERASRQTPEAIGATGHRQPRPDEPVIGGSQVESKAT